MPRGGGSGGRGGGANRGSKPNYKGKRRVFTSADEIQRQNEEERKKREWREKHGSDEEEEEGAKAKGDAEESSEESSSEEDESSKKKGISHLIEIQNPNLVTNKTKKAQNIDTDHKTTLSRREKEEIEKQQATARYQLLQSQGKTEEAQSDLARLSIIRKQREEAAKKREDEKKAKDAAATDAANKKGKS